MKSITRRLTALALCVMLALTPPLAAAQDVQGWSAQVLITLSDGMQYFVPAQLVTTTLGDSVYWVDQSMLTEEQRAAVAVGQLVLMNEAGEVVWQQPLDASGMGAPQDMPVQVADPNAPESAFTVVLGDMLAMPMSPEEADLVLGGFGYMTPEPEVTEPEITEPEIVEPEITEPEITEPEIVEPEIVEPEIVEPEIVEPEITETEITEPEIVEPEITEPEITEPEITETEITEPEIVEPEITEPEIVEPEITEPEIVEPEITEPEITEPEITEPEITEPEIVEPGITEPEITEPEITEPEEIEVEVPTYVTPNQDRTNLRSEPYQAEETLLIQVGLGDVLEVYEYYVDESGAIWWSVYDYRTGNMGYMMADVVTALDEDTAYVLMDAIDEELAAEEGEVTEPEITEPEITEPEIVEPEITEPEIVEPEIVEPEITEPEIVEPEIAEPEITEPEIVEPEIVEPEITEPEIVEPEIVEPEIVEPEITEPEITEPEITEPEATEPERSGYAVTNGSNNVNNLRSEPNAKNPISFANGELVLLGDSVLDGDQRLWYAVTVIRTGDVGYMRDYLLKEISMDEATVLLEQIAQEQEEEPETTEPEATEPEVTEPEATEPEVTEPEATEPEVTEPETTEPETTEPEATEPETTEPEVTEPEVTEPETTEPETTEPEVADPETTEPEVTEPETTEPETTEPETTEPEATEPEATEPDQAAYALTLEQDNGAAIVLVEAPGALPPASGSVTLITQPTPLLVLDQQEDEEGNLWYLVQNMCAGDSGYIPAYQVTEITREQAEDAVYEIESVIPPYQPPVEETEEPEEEPDAEPTPTPTPEPTPTPTPEPPQELVEGDVGHYGRTNNKQVKFRKAPNSKEAWGNLKEGTPLYIISNDGVWCTARAEVNGKVQDGAIMSEFVTLMGVNEEIAYAATLENPETIATPKPTETPTPEPTPDPTQTPTPLPEATEKPGPQMVEAYAIVTYDHADVRSNTDFNAALQTRLPVDTPVYVRQQMTDDEGNIWCDITYGDNQYGFILNNKLRMMTDGEVAAYLESLNTPTPSPEPTPSPVPTETPAPQELRIYARVLQNGTPLRGNPDNMAYLQNILDEGKVVYIFQSQVASDGMTWYLVQYSGQWGFVRADLVRLMGEEETNEYLAALEAEMATPTPMPMVTPEPVGPDSTSAYAKLIKDAVNLRRTPSTSGTSLGRIAKNTLLLVMGEEKDGEYTWYQVDYNGETGYVRSDMAQMLTIAELQEYLAQQTQATPVPNAGVSTTPNSSNNVSHVINGTPLKDLIPVDDSWTNNIISGMPVYATATPDPNATPSPVPVENPASLISSFGTLTVNGVPATTESGTFEVYGKTAAYTAVKATVETQSIGSAGLIASAIAESSATRKYTVGETVSDANGDYRMTVKLPQAGEYIVEFTSGTSYARYGVTYDASASATPSPTLAPMPTMEPVKEEGGFGLMPILIGGLLIVIAAVVYGVYIYMRRKEEEEEEEAEDEEEELLRERMNQQRIRQAQQSARPNAMPGANAAPRMPQSQAGQVPSYMRNAPAAPKAPVAPTAPQAPAAPKAPVAPAAPQDPAQSPYARPVAPAAPKAPEMPVAPTAPETPAEQSVAETPRRRRRPPVDPNA